MLWMIIELIHAFKLYPTECSGGYYKEGHICKPCHSSCKECDNSSQCTSCEEYMFLDLDTHLCQRCLEGYYYDNIGEQCRECDESCTGQCMAQQSCFECPVGRTFSLEMLECIDECRGVILNDDQLNLPSVCRNYGVDNTSLEYYVDPQSNQPIELGTLEFPYRSFKSVNFEIAKFFSHSNISVIIYTKDAYIEDGTNRYLNLTSVSIVAHPTYNYLTYQPILIPTAVPQPFISEKSLLHLINKVDASLEASIITAFQNGDFSDYEESLFEDPKTTILPIMTSIIVKNIDIYREETEPDSLLKFIMLGNLQTKVMHIENVNLNITGSFANNQRSANIRFENIKIDLVRFDVLYYSDFLFCNYPEAILNPELFAQNISMVNTNIYNGRAPYDILRMSDIGNITAIDIDCRNHYSYAEAPNGCLGYTVRPSCLPDDGRKHINMFKNVNLDFISPSPNYIVLNAIAANTQHYRHEHLDVDGLSCENVRGSNPYTVVGMIGTFLDTLTMKNMVFRNSTNTGYLSGGMTILSQEITNVTFIDTDEAVGHSIGCPLCINFVAKDIKYINYRISSFTRAPSIFTHPLNISTMVFDHFYIENSYFQLFPFIYAPDVAAMIQITNNYFNRTNLDGSNSFFRLTQATNFVFQNNTLLNSGALDEKDFTIFIDMLSLNLQYMDVAVIDQIRFINSSSSFMMISSIVGETDIEKILVAKDISYTDCFISHANPLISTQRQITNKPYTLNLISVRFSNVQYKSKGDIIRLGHQLKTPISIVNLTVSQVTSGRINTESYLTSSNTLQTSTNIQGITVDRVYLKFLSFIRTGFGSTLDIEQSSFTNIESVYLDSGIFSTESNSQVKIDNALFQNNSGASAIVFKIKDSSTLTCTNCTYLNNFALSNGIMSTVTNGKFIFIENNIFHNYALENSIGEIFAFNEVSIIQRSNIYQNLAISNSDFESELLNCTNLCFLGEYFKDYLASLDKSALAYSNVAMQVLFGQLLIKDSSQIYQQQKFVSAYESIVRVQDSSVSDITLSSSSFEIINSDLILENATFSNIMNPLEVVFILISSDSNVNVTSATLKDSQTALFSIQSSNATLQKISFENVTASISLIEAHVGGQFVINNLSLLQSSAGQQMLLLENTNMISLESIEVSNSEKSLFKALESNFELIKNVSIINSTHSVEILDSAVSNMTNCTFENNGNSSTAKGGAIKMTDSMITIANSTFISNQAFKGGAIAFECSSRQKCKLDISGSNFSNNIGYEEGGAIYYNYQPPTMHQTIFSNNSASYGPNLASYPYRIGLKGSTTLDPILLQDIGSGILGDALELVLYDYNNQVMNLDSTSQLVITAASGSNGTIKGTNTGIVKKGAVVLDSIYFVDKPGTSSVKFKVSSKTLNTKKISDIYNRSSPDTEIIANFRDCKPGEQHLGDQCSSCSTGTYSLQWNSRQCDKCVDNVVCEGKQEIKVSPGYWRRTSNSTQIVQCLNEEACQGGYVGESESPTQCKTGYEGPMCSKCSIIDGDKYERQNEFMCIKCPTPIINALRIAGLLFLIFCYFMALIVLNIRKTEESQVSVLLRILTNYMQLITTSMSMTLSYPSFLDSITGPLKRLGGSSDTFLSFDCFITDYEIKGSFESNEVFKLFLTIFLPVVLFAFIAALWVVMRLFSKKLVPNLTRNLVISFISIVFLLHPRLTQTSINTWRCVNIDTGVDLARFDMNIECYSASHLKYCFLIALPIMIIWVISMPVIAFILLFKVRKSGKENKIKQYFLILYQGLTPECFYWEFVNTIRKGIVLTCLLLPETGRIVLASITLVVSGRIQMSLKPYKRDSNNQVEFLAIMAGVVTILTGLVFLEQNSVESLDAFVLFIICAVNAAFILNWTYLFTQEFEEKYKLAKITNMIGCMLCKRKSMKPQSALPSAPKQSNPAKIQNSSKSDLPIPSLPRQRTPKRLFKPSHNRKRKTKARSKKKATAPPSLPPKEDPLNPPIFYPATTIRPLKTHLPSSPIKNPDY
ncbi:unnamed protein product [Moneuplotes crassus]|uniref:Uncharacterized protein n=1 Tax=Euplotes crassus TaxID=5936 RepID=A0AAD1UJS3_EUPCR|nr:unnamed protein product [Moneuplotes crassus]